MNRVEALGVAVSINAVAAVAYVQPDRNSLIAAMGINAIFHYNALQTWSIDETGRVQNVLD